MSLPLEFEWWQPLSLGAGVAIAAYFLATGGVVEGALLLLFLVVGLAGRVYLTTGRENDIDIEPPWEEQ